MLSLNSTFHPVGAHTVIYLFGNVQLNPADLFNHPGATRQDPVKALTREAWKVTNVLLHHVMSPHLHSVLPENAEEVGNYF
ncbi:hypothetical protein ILYODFUR_032736 [Ilyodon furcidens]|uniref:Uncharacterized protein n=1 Tax=Ilyodon furcidens TaxID=33524 RepID=A0ABV0TQE9_9TELE